MELELIKEGDVVILCGSSPRDLTPITVTRGKELQNGFGTFRHDDIIGRPFGSKLHSSGRTTLKGFLHVLRLTPELWTLSLPHRTQILYAADIAAVVSGLSLRPGGRVVESGTGSGSLTHALARAVGPAGHVYTFEFNAHRVGLARAEFVAHGLGPSLVTVTHRDAVADGFGPEAAPGTADAVFLDLPNPWGAIHHAAAALKSSCGRLCSFSPCIEQVQRTAREMERLGFEEIRCIETLQRPWEVQPADAYTGPGSGAGFYGVSAGAGAAAGFFLSSPGPSIDLGITTPAQARAAEAAARAMRARGVSAGSGGLGGGKHGSKRARELQDQQLAVGAQVWQPRRGAAGGSGSGAGAAKAAGKPAQTTRGHTGYLIFATLFRRPTAAAMAASAGGGKPAAAAAAVAGT